MLKTQLWPIREAGFHVKLPAIKVELSNKFLQDFERIGVHFVFHQQQKKSLWYSWWWYHFAEVWNKSSILLQMASWLSNCVFVQQGAYFRCYIQSFHQVSSSLQSSSPQVCCSWFLPLVLIHNFFYNVKKRVKDKLEWY